MNSLRRFVLALLAVAASTFVAVGVAAPAHAATTVTTRVASAITPAAGVQYGHTIKIEAQVQYDAGGTWYAADNYWGHMTLQSHAVGSSTWKTVQTSSMTDYKAWTIKPAANTYYRVIYSGGSGGGYALNASNGASKLVHVSLNLHDALHSGTVSGTVSPAYHYKHIYVQKSSCSSGCAWHNIKTLTTNGSSHYSYKLPVYSTKTYFQLYVPASSSFAKSYSNHYFYTWRG